MRGFLHRNRWATVLITGLFLLATSGLALSRMTCLMGGPSVLSIEAMDDCCPEHGPMEGATFTPDCCEMATVQNGSVNFLPHNEQDLGPALLALESAPRLLLSVGTTVTPPRADSRPPPLLGIERLVRLCVQRI
ncbi:MAG: hypothetical protein KDC00_00875 [Flavobacteriales bacterium]|nr:hypothetical protein [Flavobacteriales bacterium]